MSGRPFRIFYASDLHGSERCFRKFLNAGRFYRVDALVLGGDLTGKAIVPIVRRGGRYEAAFLGQATTLETPSELAEFEKNVRFNGFYPYRTDPEELIRLDEDERYRKSVFDRLMKETVTAWVALAEERLNGSDVALYAIGGNDDEWFVDDVLKASPIVRYNEATVHEIGPVEIVGLSWANPTPWKSPRECPEEELYSRLREIVGKLRDPERAILNVHVPPYRSGLDSAPKLNADLSVVRDGGQPVLEPVGSQAVRRIIEEVQPMLGLHGHIHESRGVRRIGRTLAVNPGSRYGEGVLDGVIITLDGRGVHAWQLVAG